MEVNSSKSNSQVLVGNATKGLQNAANRSGNAVVEEKAFADAAKVDVSNATRGETRELSSETEQFLTNNGIDLAKESANFDKQSVLGVAGSYTAAQGHANAVATRALLS